MDLPVSFRTQSYWLSYTVLYDSMTLNTLNLPRNGGKLRACACSAYQHGRPGNEANTVILLEVKACIDKHLAVYDCSESLHAC